MIISRFVSLTRTIKDHCSHKLQSIYIGTPCNEVKLTNYYLPRQKGIYTWTLRIKGLRWSTSMKTRFYFCRFIFFLFDKIFFFFAKLVILFFSIENTKIVLEDDIKICKNNLFFPFF